MSKIKPILFSTAMVQAEYANRKTQTRRTQGLEEVNKNPINWEVAGVDDDHVLFRGLNGEYVTQNRKYRKGDILWVRETFTEWPKGTYHYKANTAPGDELGIWKPSIHMPKAAARIFLEVTNVRIERLLQISEADATAEGVLRDVKHYPGDFQEVCIFRDYTGESLGCLDARSSFMTLWQAINGAESWKVNPWVWVYDFKRVDRPYNFNN